MEREWECKFTDNKGFTKGIYLEGLPPAFVFPVIPRQGSCLIKPDDLTDPIKHVRFVLDRIFPDAYIAWYREV